MKFIYRYVLFVTLLVSYEGRAQIGLKLGSSPGTLSPNAILDLSGTTNRGFLLPRLALTGTANSVPLSGTVTSGMLVYNTATAGDVTPGVYYADGSRWVRVAANGTGGTIQAPSTSLVSATSPAGTTGQIVYNTNAASGLPVGLVVWNGSAWVAASSGGADNLGNHTATEDVKLGAFGITGIAATNDPWRIFGRGSTIDNGELVIQSGDNGNEPIVFEMNNAGTGTITERMRIGGTGVVSINNLAGTGSRMVVADATGVLSAQAIPSAGAVSSVTTGNGLNLTSGVLSFTPPASLTTNLYTGDGSLSGARVVTQGTNNLTFAGAGKTIFGSTNASTATTAGRLAAVTSGDMQFSVMNDATSAIGNRANIGFRTQGSIAAGMTASIAAIQRGTGLQTDLLFGTYDGTVESTRMAITSNGFVGIGTTTPGERLTISGGTNAVAINVANSVGNARIAVAAAAFDYGLPAGGDFILQNSANRGLALGTNGDNTRLYISNTGVVSINNLAGTGSRMVVADAAGVLSTQAIPSGGGTDNLGNHTATTTLNMGRFGINGLSDATATTGNNDDWRIYGSGAANEGALIIETGDDGNEPIIFQQRVLSGAGTERMRIGANGNIGIGTNAPNAPLQFANTTVNRKIVLWEGGNNDHNYFGFGVNSSMLRYQVDGGAARHAFYAGTSATTSTELMTINGDGKVGIGTSAPGERLSIVGTGAIGINVANSLGNARIAVGELPGHYGLPVGGDFILQNTENRGLALGTNNAIRMYVAAGGNVGIGVVNPLSRLHIAGGAGDGIRIGNQLDANVGYAQLRTANGTEFPTGQGSGVLELRTTANSDAVRIGAGFDSYIGVNGGNFGIGTTTPSQKLTVTGNALISGLAGTGSRMVVADASGVLSTQAIPSGGTNLYTGDGSLSGARVVTQGTNNLTFAGAGKTIFGNFGSAVAGNITATTNNLGRLGVIGTGSNILSIMNDGTSAIGNDAGISFRTQGSSTTTGNTAFINAIQSALTAATDLSFGTFNGSTATAERMRIAANGDMGIGTSSPYSRLSVEGGTAVTGVIATPENILTLTRPGTSSVSFAPRATMALGKSSTGINSNTQLSIRLAKNSETDLMDIMSFEAPSGNVRVNNLAGTGSRMVVADAAGVLSTQAIPTGGTNLYTGDGSLSGARVVTQGTNNLTFAGAGKTIFGSTNASTATMAGRLAAVTNGDLQFSVMNDAASAIGNRANIGFRTQGSIAAGMTASIAAIQRGTGLQTDLLFGTYDGTVESTRMAITSNGFVGIGTTTPGERLTISGGTNAVAINVANSLGNARIAVAAAAFDYGLPAGGDFILQNSANRGLALGTNGDNTRLYIAAGGNVGIGITNPGANLHVVGSTLISSLAGTGSRMVVADALGTLSTQIIPAGGVNIYTGDGTLSGARALTQGANVLTFSGAGSLNKFSGAAANPAVMNFGRTASELELGVASTATNGFSSTVSGDSWFRSNGNLFLGTNSATSVRMMTNNTERLTVTATGSVGIGTTTPGERLSIVGTGAIGINVANSLGNARIAVGELPGHYGLPVGGDFILQNTANRGLALGTNGDNIRMYVAAGGNVGIGTATPASKLEVGENGTWIRLHTNMNDATLQLKPTATTNWARLTTAGSPLAILTNGVNDLSNTSPSLFITPTGNVGIGTTTPGERLTISGGTSPTGINVATSEGNARIAVGTLSGHYGLPVGGDFILQNTANRGLALGTNGDNVRMYIAAGGNVGIGITNPGANLHVVGSTLISSLAGTGSRMVVADAAGVLSTQIIPAGGTNLYVADGSLSGARVVTQGTNNLTFAGAGKTIFGSTNASTATTAGRLAAVTNGDMQFSVMNDATSAIGNRANIGFRTQGSIAAGMTASIAAIQRGTGLQTDLLFGTYDGTVESTRMAITSNGFVGIGTTTPGERLTISGGTNAVAINVANSVGNARIAVAAAAFDYGLPAGGDFILQNSANRGLALGTNGDNTRLYISNTGVVSINNLAGTGSRMVVADAAGVLSTQAIPSGGGTDNLGNHTATTTLNMGRFGINGLSDATATTGNNDDWRIYGSGAANEGALIIETGDDGNEPIIFQQRVLSGAGTERMRIGANGNIGIGTNAPNAPLQFANTTVNRKIVLWEGGNNDHNYFGFGVNSSMLRYQVDGGAARHAFYAGTSATTSTELMTINGDGKVGIGTSAPGERLSIVGTGAIGINVANSLGNARIAVGELPGHYGLPVGGDFILQNTANRGLALGTNNAIRMYVAAGGNVGIGVVNPLSRLHIAGGAGDGIRIGNQLDANVGYAQLRTANGTEFPTGQGSGVLELRTTANSDAVRIGAGFDSYIGVNGGNFGIGTTTPSQKLTVTGNALISGLAGTGSRMVVADAAGVLSTQAIPTGGTNLYTGDGSLSGARVVTQGTNNLTFAGAGKTIFGSTNASTATTAGRLAAVTNGDLQFTVMNDAASAIGNSARIAFRTQGSNTLAGNTATISAIQRGTGLQTDLLFGTYDGTVESTRMAITSNGFVGIGTTSPTERLTISGGTGAVAINVANSLGSARIAVAAAAFDYGLPAGGDFILQNSANRGLALGTNGDNTRLYIAAAGNVGINTTTPGYTLHVNGSVAGTSAYFNLSDARLKTNIQPLANSLEKVKQLKGVTFDWNQTADASKKLDDKNHIGFVAQEVEKILPQVVNTASDEQKTKSVAYSDIIPVLVEAIKELSSKNEALQKQVGELEQLKAEVASIKALLQGQATTTTIQKAEK
ncbi:MAG: tail fiber domain-containing protein [Spirosomataceae bacterium]